ncbi:hypothetical protein BASH2_03529 [Bacillus anthracis]|nr:hypothetical protein BASH2_03529 [Bacillus anthracis]
MIETAISAIGLTIIEKEKRLEKIIRNCSCKDGM